MSVDIFFFMIDCLNKLSKGICSSLVVKNIVTSSLIDNQPTIWHLWLFRKLTIVKKWL